MGMARVQDQGDVDARRVTFIGRNALLHIRVTSELGIKLLHVPRPSCVRDVPLNDGEPPASVKPNQFPFQGLQETKPKGRGYLLVSPEFLRDIPIINERLEGSRRYVEHLGPSGTYRTDGLGVSNKLADDIPCSLSFWPENNHLCPVNVSGLNPEAVVDYTIGIVDGTGKLE